MAKTNPMVRISFPTEFGYPLLFSREFEGMEMPYVFTYRGTVYTWSGDDEEQTISRASEAEIMLYEQLQRVKERLSLCLENCGEIFK